MGAHSKPCVTAAEIREIILAQQESFQSSDVAKLVKEKYPAKELPETKTHQVIFNLKKTGLVKEVTPRNGATQAKYARA